METSEIQSKGAINTTLIYTKTITTKLFDTVDSIDRSLYGRRMKLFILFSIAVLAICPILDEIFKTDDKLTFWITLLFFLYCIIMVLSFIGSWRDESGNWTWRRAGSKLKTYYGMFSDTVRESKTNSRDEALYKFGRFLFLGAVIWQAIHNLSIFVRHSIGIHSIKMIEFEHYTKYHSWIPFILGLGIIYYLYRKSPVILKRIKNELMQLFALKNNQTRYKTENIKIETIINNDLVINAKQEEHVKHLISTNKSILFNDFIVALQKWNPRGAYYEYEFQDKLHRHLRNHMPDAVIDLEYPIGSYVTGDKGRADIVINDTILIEMKRDASTGAIQRAKGQISQYANTWKERGPIILLLCSFEYEHAKLVFTPTMQELAKNQHSVLTIVATNSNHN